MRPERLTPEQVSLSRYRLKAGRKTTNWLRESRGLAGEPYGLEADAFSKELLQATFVAEATPYLQEPAAARATDDLLALLEAEAQRRTTVLSVEDVVERIARMSADELLTLVERLRRRLPSGAA